MRGGYLAPLMAVVVCGGVAIAAPCLQIKVSCTDGGAGFCTSGMTVCEQGLRTTFPFECGYSASFSNPVFLYCYTYTSPFPGDFFRGPCDKTHPGFNRVNPGCRLGTDYLNCCWTKITPTSSVQTVKAILPDTTSPVCCP